MYPESDFDQYMFLLDINERRLGSKYDPANLFPETYNYEDCFKNEESADATRKSDKEESVDLSDMPPLEGDEEVK